MVECSPYRLVESQYVGAGCLIRLPKKELNAFKSQVKCLTCPEGTEPMEGCKLHSKIYSCHPIVVLGTGHSSGNDVTFVVLHSIQEESYQNVWTLAKRQVQDDWRWFGGIVDGSDLNKMEDGYTLQYHLNHHETSYSDFVGSFIGPYTLPVKELNTFSRQIPFPHVGAKAYNYRFDEASYEKLAAKFAFPRERYVPTEQLENKAFTAPTWRRD